MYPSTVRFMQQLLLPKVSKQYLSSGFLPSSGSHLIDLGASSSFLAVASLFSLSFGFSTGVAGVSVLELSTGVSVLGSVVVGAGVVVVSVVLGAAVSSVLVGVVVSVVVGVALVVVGVGSVLGTDASVVVAVGAGSVFEVVESVEAGALAVEAVESVPPITIVFGSVTSSSSLAATNRLLAKRVG